MPSIATIAHRLRYQLRQRGLLSTLRFLASRLGRHEVRAVYSADLRRPCQAVEWKGGERLVVVGPHNLESALTPRVVEFLRGSASECLAGIRSGDRLFIVADAENYLHRGYVVLTGRAKKLLDEPPDVPLIGYCYTAEAARGRGLYRRALVAELQYLQALGYKRVVIDSDPRNYASRKGIEAAGFAFARTVNVWIFLNLFALRQTITPAQRTWRALLLWAPK
jgi:hypothetical protein